MKYSLIYADPPWQYDNSASRAAAGNHYSTMSLSHLKRLPIWDLAADDAVLAMWWVPPMPVEAIELAQAWGFRVKNMCMFTWAKLNEKALDNIDRCLSRHHEELGAVDSLDFLTILNDQTRMGMGNYTRGNAENVMVAVRGRGIERISASIKQMVHSPVAEHSAKPAEIRHRLEQLYGEVSRIELFSRGGAEGWDHWGNEATKSSIEIVPGSIQQPQIQPQKIPEIIPETDNDVWPAEVQLLAGQLPQLANLATDHQRKVKHHINRMLLERQPSAEIIAAAQSLTATFGEQAQ